MLNEDVDHREIAGNLMRMVAMNALTKTNHIKQDWGL